MFPAFVLSYFNVGEREREREMRERERERERGLGRKCFI